MSKKCGIIVPYRNRHKHLKLFTEKLPRYLSNRSINYTIIIVQQDNASAFNRGMLCNIGYLEAVKQKCDYVVFHDVDMIPKDVDYSWSRYPVHLATDNLSFDSYFGGITLFPVDEFKRIDGFSNNFWGWGFEDDDLLLRCVKKNVILDRVTVNYDNSNRGTIKLNGVSAYITAPNIISYRRDFSFGIKVTLDKIELDHSTDSDIFDIVNIKGYDFSLHYNSFKRFALQFFDSQNKFYQIFSDIHETSQNYLFVNYFAKDKVMEFYVDGNKLGEVKLDSTLKTYGSEDIIYLGCNSDQENFFNGSIESFCVFDKTLEKKEIQTLSTNYDIGLTSNYGDYLSSRHIKIYYDSRFMYNYKLIDLSSNRNEGLVYNAYTTKLGGKSKKIFYKPKRRKSKIKYLKHEDGGFVGGRWKDDLTRWNQLRFNNEIKQGRWDYVEDGLSSLEFKLHGKNTVNKITYLNVGL